MSFIRDLVFWLLIRCWRVFLALGLLFLITISYFAIQHYWSAAKTDMASIQVRIAQAQADLEKELNVKDNAYRHMEDLNTKKPWKIDPKMILWAYEYLKTKRIFDMATQAADTANNKIQQSKTELENLRTGKWWLVGVAERSWSMVLGYLGIIVFSIFCVPSLWKAFWFYLMAPIASRAAPIQIENKASQALVNVS
ncbi:MAG: hypothetical protein ACKO8Z_08820, partial [Prosthecobacter sp.]